MGSKRSIKALVIIGNIVKRKKTIEIYMAAGQVVKKTKLKTEALAILPK